MKKILVKHCWQCPNYTKVYSELFCDHNKFNKQGGRTFNPSDDTDTFPTWCPLTDYKK